MTASTRSRRGALLDGPAPPRLLVAPSARANSWEDVADLSASLGMPLDEWQEQVLEAAMGERADGRWASKFVGVSAPRQNGKSQLIVARALAGALLFDEKMIIISAHETDTAREIWKRLLDVVEDNPTVEARVTGRMDAINREFISFGTGAGRQTIKLKARRASGARGFSADCLLLDEAQILGKQSWGSIVPTMSAMPNPQMWLFGTPPTETDDPFAFGRLRESATARKARHCWLEWAAEPGDDLNSAEVWAKANPAYGKGKEVARSVVPKEGALGWVDGPQIVKGAKNRANALAFINFFAGNVKNQDYLWDQYFFAQCSKKSTERTLAANDAGTKTAKAIGADRPELAAELLMLAPPDDAAAWTQAYDNVIG